MKYIRRGALAALFLQLILLCGAALASLYGDADTLSRAISSNQDRIRRLRAELSGMEGKTERVAKINAQIQELEATNTAYEIQLYSIKRPRPTVPSDAAPVKMAAQEGIKLDPQNFKGKDWREMTWEQKELFAETIIEVMKANGAPVEKSPAYYAQAVSVLLGLEHSFDSEYLEDLFIFTVYENEPDTRKAINKLRTTP